MIHCYASYIAKQCCHACTIFIIEIEKHYNSLSNKLTLPYSMPKNSDMNTKKLHAIQFTHTGSILFYKSHRFLYLIFAFFGVCSCTKIEDKRTLPVASENTEMLRLHPDKPNIILIMAEDMGYEVPRVNGGQSYQTPTLDRIAQEGMRFTQCHGSAMCAPSRWMLMTGKYNFRNYFYYGKLYTDQRTIGNMLQDAGYKTGVFGKWALDGGDTSIHTFGFDNYVVWNPYKFTDGTEEEAAFFKTERAVSGNIYMNTHVYHEGAFLPDSVMLGKYSDDVFTDSVLNFIDVNKNEPFFAYYPMILSHIPASPTPDNPEFTTWDPGLNIDDTNFFASQVKYADKKIRQIIEKVNKLNIASETVILVLFGDNGTREGVTSLFNGQLVPGSRKEPTEYGTHVPFFVLWPGKVAPGTVSKDLIDFTDFLPTLAGIANIPVPGNYGKLDGVSFYPRLLGEAGTPREWIYNYYWPVPNRPALKNFYEWVQTKDYKLFDSSSQTMNGDFYKFVNFTEQQPKLNLDSLTKREKNIHTNLLNVLKMQHNDPEYRTRY
jgi:arylsulfatase A